MQKGLTGDVLFNNVLMLRQTDPRLFLLVEGPEDVALLTGHIDDSSVLIIVGHGKPPLLRAAELFDRVDFDRARVLIDRDLDDLLGISATYPRSIVATTTYDLTSDIMQADKGLLRRAAVAHAGVDSVLAVEDATGVEFGKATAAVATPLSFLRLVNATGGHGLNLRAFPFHEVVVLGYSPDSSERYLDRANARSGVSVLFAMVEPDLVRASSILRGKAEYLGGHDLLGAAAALVRKAGSGAVGHDGLAKSIQTAASCVILKSLAVYVTLETWAATFSLRAFAC